MPIGAHTGACHTRAARRGAPAVAGIVAGVAALAGPAGAATQTLNEVARRQVPPVTHASPASSWIAALVQPVVARKAPDVAAPRAAVLRPSAPYSGRASAHMADGAAVDSAGRDWIRVQLARRPNGATGWIPASAAYLTTTQTRIVVRRAARRLDVWRGSRRVRSFPAGVGRAGTPTPTGRFAVEDSVPTPPSHRRAYGRHIVTLTAHSEVLLRFNGGDGQVAIHGTGTLGRVGRPSSHGCIVLADDALRYVVRQAPAGTPVTVVP